MALPGFRDVTLKREQSKGMEFTAAVQDRLTLRVFAVSVSPDAPLPKINQIKPRGANLKKSNAGRTPKRYIRRSWEKKLYRFEISELSSNGAIIKRKDDYPTKVAIFSGRRLEDEIKRQVKNYIVLNKTHVSLWEQLKSVYGNLMRGAGE